MKLPKRLAQFINLLARRPLCLVRIDGGAADLPPTEWKFCLRPASGSRIITVVEADKSLWQYGAPLCKTHSAKPTEKSADSRTLHEITVHMHIGIHARIWKDCTDLEFYPLNWGFCVSHGRLWFGPFSLRVRQQ